MVNQKKTGVLLSYAAQAAHILTSLLYVPIMLRTLGQSEYGLYQLASATISNLNILTLGFNSAYIRFYSRYRSEDDEEGIARLNGMFITIFSVLSLICLACGSFIVINARTVLGDELTDGELEKAKILMLILVVSMSVTFITSVFQSQVSAYEKFVWLKGLDLIGYIVSPCISLPLLIMGFGSVGLVSVTLFVNIFICVCNLFYAFFKLKIRYSFRHFDWKLFREMSAFTFYVFINIIVEQINWSIDKFLLGRMKGTGAVAVYSVGAQIISLYRSISGTIRGVFVPQINRMVAGHASLEDINVLFIKLGRVIFMVAFLIYSGFLVFGKEFISFWAGDGYDNSFWCAIIPMTALIVPIIQGPGIDIQRAMNRHQARSIAYVCIAAGNLLVSIALIGRFGEIGASVGTAVALILGQGLFMNYYYHKKIGLNMWKFWKSILAFTSGCAILLLAGYVIKVVAYPDSLLILISEIILYSAIYCVVIYFVCMNEYERGIVKSTMCKIRRIGK